MTLLENIQNVGNEKIDHPYFSITDDLMLRGF
jgi:hypothetical protein